MFPQLCVLFYFSVQHFPGGICAYFTSDWDLTYKKMSLVFSVNSKLDWRHKAVVTFPVLLPRSSGNYLNIAIYSNIESKQHGYSLQNDKQLSNK